MLNFALFYNSRDNKPYYLDGLGVYKNVKFRKMMLILEQRYKK